MRYDHGVAVWMTLGVALGSPCANGQSSDAADETPIEEIVVTGIRQSLSEARSIKRDSSQLVDAIVADDIGKLPDTNVAESLARVSGVQIDRGIGEGSDISIRGLRQNVILFNGRQIFDATGRGGNGLDQLFTSTYGLLALVPSELISRLEVTKLAGADEIAGALGGVVDIIPRKPLDTSGLQLVGNLAATYDDRPEKAGYEAFGLYSGTFANDTFGALLSVATADRELAEEGLNTFSGYGVIGDNSAPLTDAVGNPVSDDPDGDGVSGLFHLDPRLQQIAEERERIGVNGILQWRPAADLELTLDTFYADLDSKRDRYWIGYFAGFGPHRDVTFSPNEILLSGIVTRPIQTNVEFADVEAEISSSALGMTWEATPALSLSTEVAYTNSKSSYDQIYVRLQSNTATDITYDFTTGDFGSFTFPADLADPSALNMAILFDNLFASETDDLALRADLEWTVDSRFVSSIETGVRYQNLDTSNDQILVDIRPAIPATELADFITLFSNPDFLEGELPGLPRSYLSADERAVPGCEAFSSVFTPAQQALCDDKLNPTNPGSLLNTFDLEEEFLALYGMLNFGGSDDRLSGNVGLRYVDRQLTSTGNRIFEGQVTANVFDRSDGELLPSAVLKLAATDELVVRLGGAQVLAFPNTEDLNNGLQLFGDFRGIGGSPDLDPFKANQFDASLEYYFAEDSLLSLGLFYKDIDTFIVQSTRQEDIPGFDMPFAISRKINGDSAEVRGVELLYQQPFTMLPEPFEGFGVVATYSYIDSETPITDANGRNLPLPGLSENNVNFIAYYERGPFSGRLAYNWRDEYLQGIGPADTGIFFDEYTDLAFTMRWSFSDNFLANFEAINLLDEQLETFNAVPEGLRTNVDYGRVYKLTFSARY